MSAINTRYYGAEEDWHSFSTNCPELKTSGIEDTNRSLSDSQKEAAVGSVDAFSYSSDTNPEQLASVPLDPSICPWGIGLGSDVFDQKYPYPSIVGGTEAGVVNFQFKIRVSDYYKPKDNKGYRFFISRCRTLQTMDGGKDGTWDSRYAELSLRGELNQQYIYQRPIVEFDYSKAYIVPYLLYVNKTYIDDKTTNHTSTSVNRVELGRIKASDGNPLNINDNYVYGVQFDLRYEGLESAHTLSIFPFDDIEPTDMAPGPYYPYGRKYTHYATPFITAYDTGQINRCSIGGTMNVNIRDNNQFIDTEEAIYNKNYTETTNLRHYNFPTISGDDGDYVLCNYIRRSSTTVSLVPYTMNTLGRDGILDYVMKQAAYLGFRFKLKANDTDYYLPIMDSNGITTGNYLSSNDPDIENQDNNSWTTDVFERTPYSPGGGDDGDPNTYQDGTSIAYRRPFATVGNYHYLMSAQGVKAFFKTLNELISTVSQDPNAYADDMIEYFGTQDPYELIDTIMIFPRDFTYPLANYPNSTLIDPLTMTEPADYIYIGNTKIPVTGWNQHIVRVLGTEGMVNLEPFEYYDKYKSFLDYNPYSSAQIILPWCGSIDLDAQTYMGKTIQPLYYIDIQSGLCKVFLGAGESMGHIALTDTITGQVGARVQITSQDYSAQINAAIQANQIQQQQRFNQVKNAASLLTGGALAALTGTGGADVAGATVNTMFGMAASEMAIDQANYRVETTAVPFKQVVSGTDTLSLSGTDGYAVNIFRPKFLPTYDAAEYGKQVGFATLEFGPLSNYHGYTEVETINFDGVFATETEQEMIKSALKTGVYLP